MKLDFGKLETPVKLAPRKKLAVEEELSKLESFQERVFVCRYLETGKHVESYAEAYDELVLTPQDRQRLSYAARKLITRPDIRAVMQRVSNIASAAMVSTVAERKCLLTALHRATFGDVLSISADDGVKLAENALHNPALKKIRVRRRKGRGGEAGEEIEAELHSPLDAIKELNRMDGVGGQEADVTVVLDFQRKGGTAPSAQQTLDADFVEA